MSPVVAVCPVHRTFPSRAFNVSGSSNITLTGCTEPCPQCGRISAVMEGVFDFDIDGFATVLSGPEWTVEALHSVQSGLREAGRALADTKYSDKRAYRLLDAKLDLIAEQNGQLISHVDSLNTEVRALTAKLSRGRLATVLIALAALIGFVSDVGGAVEVTGDAFAWVVQQVEQGLEPTAPDLAPALPAPERAVPNRQVEQNPGAEPTESEQAR